MHNARINIYDETLTPPSWRAATPADFAGGGGGGGAGDASAANQVALKAVIGSTDDAAWDGVAEDATVVSLLKALVLNTQEVVVV